MADSASFSESGCKADHRSIGLPDKKRLVSFLESWNEALVESYNLTSQQVMTLKFCRARVFQSADAGSFQSLKQVQARIQEIERRPSRTAKDESELAQLQVRQQQILASGRPVQSSAGQILPGTPVSAMTTQVRAEDILKRYHSCYPVRSSI